MELKPVDFFLRILLPAILVAIAIGVIFDEVISLFIR